MQLFWRAALYAGLGALVASASLLACAEVLRDEVREEESRYDAEDEELARGGAPFEERAAARERRRDVAGVTRQPTIVTRPSGAQRAGLLR